MAKVKTIYDFDATAVQNTDEIVFNVPDSDTNPVIDFEKRLFTQSTLTIYTATGGGGTQLTFGVDYQVTKLNDFATAKVGLSVYAGISIINAAYFDTDLYIPAGTLDLYGDNVSANDVNRLQEQIDLLSVGAGGVPIGTILPCGDTPPVGYILADGSTYPNTSYPQLLSVRPDLCTDNLDGTFTIADLRGIGIVGAGSQTIGGVTYGGSAVGDFEADQMQRITGKFGGSARILRSGTSDSSGAITDRIGANDGPSGAANATFDGFNFDSANSPDARTGTYTRGPAIAQNWCVKALEVTGAGDLVLSPIPVYDSGWSFTSTTLNQRFPADYSLIEGLSGKYLPDFDVTVLFSASGLDQDAFDIKTASIGGTVGNPSGDGVVLYQKADDVIEMQTGIDGVMFVQYGGGSAYITGNIYYRIIIKPKIHTDLAILQNNGGYNLEEYVPLATADRAYDLTSFFQQRDGFILSIKWDGGDGTHSLTFPSVSGKTIGGVNLFADLKGQGKGRLTLRKDGNNARILFYRDVESRSFNGINEKWVKHSDGAYDKSRTFFYIGTYGGLFTALDEIMPIVGESAVVSGGNGTTGDALSAYVYKSSSTRFILHRRTGGAGADVNIDSGDSGSFEFDAGIIVTNGSWTTLSPEVG